jgi:hypothetical protein
MKRTLWKLAILAALLAGGFFLYAKILGAGLKDGAGVIFVQ